jgi:LysM repeat protein
LCFATEAGCSQNCNSYNCVNDNQCVQAAKGTPAKYPNRTACDANCKAPPGPTPIPPCNATNYREFGCTTANDTEGFPSLATKLHVNPHKLHDYNFIYDYEEGVKPGDSLRVPYDQCTPKPGAWNCYTVKEAGGALTSIATGPQSLIQGVGAADKLKSYNLDIVYGDDTLYPGQQLRLPIHICFEDEKLDCHIVKAKEALESIAKTYKTTAVDLCKTNSDVILPQEPYPCDGWAIGIAVVVGMELSVPTLRPAPPSPCREIPDYWSCYTVKANDTIYSTSAITPGIASRFGISADELIEVNFGKSPNRCGLAPPNYTEGCSNTTHCPPSKGPYPDCLKIGQVLAVPVAPACEPRPGVWDCTPNMQICNETMGPTAAAAVTIATFAHSKLLYSIGSARPITAPFPDAATGGPIAMEPVVLCAQNSAVENI